MPDTQVKRRILICDDEVIIATDLKSRLQKLGYTVCAQSTSGEKALELVEQHQPDLVMMDIVLHGEMDGINAAEVIRKKWGIPVVFLTAYADTERLERAKLTYPFGYLLKPYQDRDLKITVEMALYVAKVDADRKKAECELKEKERILNYSQRSAKIGSYEWDVVNNSVIWSDEMYSIFGVYKNTYKPTIENFSELVHPDDIHYLSPETFSEMTKDDSGNMSYRIISQNTGDIKHIHLLFENIFDENGNVILIRGTFQDITDRKKAEEKVKKQKYYLEKSQELGRIGTWELDLIHNKLVWTDENCRIFGVPAGSVVNYEIFLDKVYPDDREYVDREWKAALEGKPYDIEHRIVVDSKISWVREKAEVEFNDEGVAANAIGFTQDITDRRQVDETLKKSEEFYRLILSSITDAVFLTDDDGKFLFVCPNVDHAFGFTEEEVNVFGNIDALLGTDFVENIDFDNQDEIENIELQIIDKYGKKHYLLINVLRVSIRQGSLLWVCRDITERKKAQIELDNIKKRLESLWNLAKLSDDDYKTICDQILKEIQLLTESQYSFFGFLNDDETLLDIYSWSPEALKECQVIDEPIHFPIDKAGLWGEAVRQKRPLIQNDYHKDHQGKIGLPEGHVQINRLATVPIISKERIISVAAVANKQTEYTEDDIKMIQTFAINAQLLLDHRKRFDKITKAEKEKETLLKELNHRVKNNMQVIISLMRLQADRIESEELRTHFLESQNRIYAMSAVHETLHQSENLSSVDLEEYVTKLSDTTFQTYRTDSGNVQFSREIQSIPVDLERSYPIGLVVNELLCNALKYAFPDGQEGEVSVLGELEGSSVKLVVSDTGVGIPDDFDLCKVDSLGLQLVRTLVENQLQGSLNLDRTHGTKWTITFPV